MAPCSPGKAVILNLGHCRAQDQETGIIRVQSIIHTVLINCRICFFTCSRRRIPDAAVPWGQIALSVSARARNSGRCTAFDWEPELAVPPVWWEILLGTISLRCFHVGI